MVFAVLQCLRWTRYIVGLLRHTVDLGYLTTETWDISSVLAYSQVRCRVRHLLLKPPSVLGDFFPSVFSF